MFNVHLHMSGDTKSVEIAFCDDENLISTLISFSFTAVVKGKFCLSWNLHREVKEQGKVWNEKKMNSIIQIKLT